METVFYSMQLLVLFVSCLKRTLLYGNSFNQLSYDIDIDMFKKNIVVWKLIIHNMPTHLKVHVKFKKNIVVWKHFFFIIHFYHLFCFCLKRTLLYGNSCEAATSVGSNGNVFKKNIVVWKRKWQIYSSK